MNNIKIKYKLIILFIVIKVIPLLVISYIAIIGAKSLEEYFSKTITSSYEKSKTIVESTALNAIDDSIKLLDKKSQTSVERLSYEIAQDISKFLYERDNDILFLSQIDLNDNIVNNFYKSKTSKVLTHEKYIYDDTTSSWISTKIPENIKRKKTEANLSDNEKEFNYTDPKEFVYENLPIYKEVVYFDLAGNEIYKKSSIKDKKTNIFEKENTYIGVEDYKDEISNLKEGEIYVSDVIGEYVGTKIIGNFTKEKAKKAGIDFTPEDYAYAGRENPVGKRFEGIIRYITPKYKNGKKIGYISLALDHKHIMEFTDTSDPINPIARQNIKDGSLGNYAFMWDYEGRNIAHSRDYFISGFDKDTKQRVPGWLSLDIIKKYQESNQSNLNEFLKTYPPFYEQSLSKKPNINQLKIDGKIPLDCRYLNFAPQCEGWMQLTQNGGYGSFVIFWSNVWKLTTAAAIPYYTGKYGESKRGFGFVTIGANVDEFHAAANEAKVRVEKILETQTAKMEKEINSNKSKVDKYVSSLINELSFVTFIMLVIVILIAVWMSNYITSKIENLIIGTKKFSENDLNYRIKISSKDEIGKLEQSFNNMAGEIQNLLNEQKQLNEHLEHKVKEKTAELIEINENLEYKVKQEVSKNRQKDAQLVEQSKMAAIGEMISLIIHQWKQPLNAIGMLNSRIKLRMQLGQLDANDIENDTNSITKQIQLMSDTMSDFRNFFKTTEKQSYDVTRTVQNAINLLNDIYKSLNVIINFNEKNIYMTNGYPNELIQVIINIFNNARDEIMEKKVEFNFIDVSIEETNEYIVIKISDYAGGIPQNIIEKLFEPYFTTKDEDKGTGLGLYMSKSIIEKVDGKLEVENIMHEINEKNVKGALFSIKLHKN